MSVIQLRILNRVQLTLTRYLWLRLFNAKFKKVERIALSYGQEVEVIVYAADYTGRMGQYTLFGTIIVDELAFRCPRYLKRVITHELAHKHQWYGCLAYPLVIIFGLVAFYMLLAALATFILSVFLLSAKSALGAVYFLLFSIPVVIIPCAYSWFIEYKAEAETFRRLGIETVLEIDSMLPAHSKAPVFWRVVNRMTHPPPKLVENIYRRFNRLNYKEQKP